jgi:hypothetical protein
MLMKQYEVKKFELTEIVKDLRADIAAKQNIVSLIPDEWKKSLPIKSFNYEIEKLQDVVFKIENAIDVLGYVSFDFDGIKFGKNKIDLK